MIQWLAENKEWAFSGIGVTAISYVIYLFKRNKEKDKEAVRQTQTSGNNSTNYQSARDINIKK